MKVDMSADMDMFEDIVHFGIPDKMIDDVNEKVEKLGDLDSQYKHGDIEPLDVMEEQGWLEGFCYGNIIKYAMRRKGSDKEDLQKIVDYAKILMSL